VGVAVESLVPLHGAAHLHTMPYLRAKRRRLGHAAPSAVGAGLTADSPSTDALLGELPEHAARAAVILKFAQTLDGRIAARGGDSRWISGTEERRLTHALRAACDAVLVGVGTVVRDDPQLTVRLVDGRSPARVVLDPSLRTPVDARLFEDDVPVILVAGPNADPERADRLRGRGAGIVAVPAAPAGVDLPAALRAIRALGFRSVLTEGGARVLTSFLLSGEVDRVIVSVAPLVLGRGVDAVDDLGSRRIADAVRLEDRVVRQVGDDIVIAGTPAQTRLAVN